MSPCCPLPCPKCRSTAGIRLQGRLVSGPVSCLTMRACASLSCVMMAAVQRGHRRPPGHGSQSCPLRHPQPGHLEMRGGRSLICDRIAFQVRRTILVTSLLSAQRQSSVPTTECTRDKRSRSRLFQGLLRAVAPCRPRTANTEVLPLSLLYRVVARAGAVAHHRAFRLTASCPCDGNAFRALPGLPGSVRTPAVAAVRTRRTGVTARCRHRLVRRRRGR